MDAGMYPPRPSRNPLRTLRLNKHLEPKKAGDEMGQVLEENKRVYCC